MSTYKIKPKAITRVSFNQNKREYIPPTTTLGRDITLANELSSIVNTPIFANDVTHVESLTKTNDMVANTNYPFNTAVFLGHRIPYLPIGASTLYPYESEIYSTLPVNDGYKPTFYHKYFEYKQYERVAEFPDSSVFTDLSIAFGDFIDNLPDIETQSAQSFQTLAEPDIRYFYYRSMNGTCPGCEVNGLEMTGGVSYPSGDSPDEMNPDGYPLVLTSCTDYDLEVARQSGTSAIMSEFTWSFTYLDESSISGVSLNPCDELPSDVTAAFSYVGANERICDLAAETYPNIDIFLNMYDTEVVYTGTPPSSPVGTPCSDLFGEYA